MISLLFNAALILAVSGDRRTAQAVPAHARHRETCDQKVTDLPCNVFPDVIQKDGLFSISKETLAQDCPKLLGSFRCLSDHWNKCSPVAAHNLLSYTSGLKGVVEELCDSNSALRKDYENNIPCLSTSSQSLMNCMITAEKKSSLLLRKSRPSYLLNASAYRCLAHIELVSCVRTVASDLCGSDAGQLLGRLVERSVRPYRLLNCHYQEKINRPSKKEEYKRLLF